MVDNTTQIRLTVAEVAALWTQYQNDSMALCVLSYYLSKVEDQAVREVLDSAWNISRNNVEFIKNTLVADKFAVPVGFGKDDVNLNAPRLFDDMFFLYYTKQMSRLGLVAYATSLPLTVRSDIRQFYQSCLRFAATLDSMATNLMLEKGVYVRPPFIPPTGEPHFAKSQDFLGSFFEGTRPLNAIEVTNLYANIQTNLLGKAVIMGFSQVAVALPIREYFIRGNEIAAKHIELFSAVLHEENLPSQVYLDGLVTASTEAPFSDKLMLFHISALNAAGTGNYGASISTSQRYDLHTLYARLAAEIGLFAEDGLNIMIENGWLEEMPQAVNRRELALAERH